MGDPDSPLDMDTVVGLGRDRPLPDRVRFRAVMDGGNVVAISSVVLLELGFGIPRGATEMANRNRLSALVAAVCRSCRWRNPTPSRSRGACRAGDVRDAARTLRPADGGPGTRPQCRPHHQEHSRVRPVAGAADRGLAVSDLSPGAAWPPWIPSATLAGGEVSEWLKVPLSKSGVVLSHRGFESHPLRPEPVRPLRHP